MALQYERVAAHANFQDGSEAREQFHVQVLKEGGDDCRRVVGVMGIYPYRDSIVRQFPLAVHDDPPVWKERQRSLNNTHAEVMKTHSGFNLASVVDAVANAARANSGSHLTIPDYENWWLAQVRDGVRPPGVFTILVLAGSWQRVLVLTGLGEEQGPSRGNEVLHRRSTE